MATKVIVELPGAREYAVRIGSGILPALGKNLRGLPQFANARDILVISDSNVAPLYLAGTKAALAEAGFKVADIVVPAGEDTKNPEIVSEIWSAMAQLSLGRDCVVVALGGGVVGDLAGFVAATYLRGVAVVQVPTTLLAMVDSSVGGKTAVNVPEGKNLVGAFHQPSFVCADVDTLSTLPDREWRCGCGEIAKSAIVDSDDFAFWMLDHGKELAGRDPAATVEAIKRCVVFKANVVARDERETSGVRECLNYGHTLGHAIETACGFGTFSHGEAVAEGMRFAVELARAQGGVADGFAEAQSDLLDALGLPGLQFQAAAEDLLQAMKRDKKTRGGHVRFVLVRDVAKWEVAPVGDDIILDSLHRWLNG